MFIKINLTLILFSSLFISSCQDAGKAKIEPKYDPCVSGRDTLFHMSFSKDTALGDFYGLMAFIESKGEFSGFQQSKCWFGDSVFLQKLICPAKFEHSLKESWLLEHIFSVSYILTSAIPVKLSNRNYFPKVYLTQFNFTSEAEKRKAFRKILEVGWGDPLHKWNDFFIAHGKTRIIVLETGAGVFSAIKDKYGHIIQEQWFNSQHR